MIKYPFDSLTKEAQAQVTAAISKHRAVFPALGFPCTFRSGLDANGECICVDFVDLDDMTITQYRYYKLADGTWTWRKGRCQ